MTAYCPSPLLMNRPATINTSLHYPILSLPSNAVQPSSPSLSRSKKQKKHSVSAASSVSSSTCAPAAPSRLAAFLASLLPLPASATPADHERVKHRHCSDLSFPASSAAILERCLSSADLSPIVSLTLTRCVLDAQCVDALMRGLASHTALQSLSFEHCGDGVDSLAVVRQLSALPSLTSLSFWATSLASLHKHDMHTILSLPALASLNVASSGLPLHSQHSVVSSLSSPSSRLAHLDLSNTGCDLSVAQLLASSLPSNSHLTSLTLHSNRIGREGVLVICSSLSANTTLCRLDLRWNRLFTPSPADSASSVSVVAASLDTLVSSLQSNTALTSLLLCGHADPAAANLQSAVDIFTQRNRALRQPQQLITDGTAAEANTYAKAPAPSTAAGKKDSLSTHVNPLQLSPPLGSSRSYSHSLSSAASPFSLSLEPMPSPSAAESTQSPLPSSPSPAASPAASTVDARLSSVVLQQESEIARQSKVISRLRAMVKRQEEAIKSTKAQLRNQRLTPPVDASPPLPPRPTTPRTPKSTAAEPWTPLSAASAASDSGAAAVSPPTSARGSFTLESGAAPGQAEEDESAATGQEFRVNLDLAATVVLLEQEKSAQERLMEEMRQSIRAQEAAAATAQPLPPPAAECTTPTREEHTEAPSSGSASPPSGAVPAAGVLRVHDEERGRLVAEVADLRHQLTQLQLQAAHASHTPIATGLRRDSAHHAAALLAVAKAEGERAVRERDDKIQALLSAQRVLAESREVQLAAMRREWREKEKEWKEQLDRMREEVRRLRRRNNRLSNEPIRDKPPSAAVHPTDPTLQQQPSVERAVSASEGGHSSSSESSDSSDSSDGEHGPKQLSSSQPLPQRSPSSSFAAAAPPAIPPKPAHLGSVIAARIAALEAHKAAEEAGRSKQARSLPEEPRRERRKSRRQQKREAEQHEDGDEAAEQPPHEQQQGNEVQTEQNEAGKEAQEEKVAT